VVIGTLYVAGGNGNSRCWTASTDKKAFYHKPWSQSQYQTTATSWQCQYFDISYSEVVTLRVTRTWSLRRGVVYK